MSQQQEFSVAILGAGIGGLGMGMRLTQSGEHSFVILEKAADVGGTWRDNSYPGASCDVQSHLYWFSFDEQPDWSRVFAFQPEIKANIDRLVDRMGLRRHIRLNTEVTGAHWDEAAGVWRITVADGSEVRAKSLVTAWGQLNRPTYRDIPGRETFRGESWHSARWNHDVDLAGKRVACIGNGASAAQLIPEVAEVAGELTVFQRTPNYVVPREDRPYDQLERKEFLEQPDKLRASRDGFYWEHEGWMGAMKQGTDVAAEFTAAARAHLEAQVPDPALRKVLWPDYPIGCKRIIIADTFYPALVRDNVSLVTDKIEGVEEAGIRTSDGTLHEFDVIVYATGFETLSFNSALDITGRGGVSLNEAWRDGPQAYLGVTVSGFPNMFMLYGPNTNLGHNSIITMLECQFDYVLQGLEVSREKDAAIDVRADVQRRFNDELQAELSDSSFAGSCNSWYKTAAGRITNNWMGSVEDYKAATRLLDVDAYDLVPTGS
jgi:cation diffusion facilitator CzcD-associated flavoprotein CzcO